MILFNATSRRACALSDDKLTTGSVGIQVEFTFSDDWAAAPARIAVFRGSGQSVDVHLTEDSCTVPPEVLTQPGSTLTIGVYGTDGAGTVVIPTVYAEAGQIRRGAEPSGVDPTPQTQPLIDQLLAAAQAARDAADEAERLAQSIRDDADNGEFDGSPGADGSGIWYTKARISGGEAPFVRRRDLIGREGATVQVHDLLFAPDVGDEGEPTTLYEITSVDTACALKRLCKMQGEDGTDGNSIWRTDVEPTPETILGATRLYYNYSDLSGATGRVVQQGDLIVKSCDDLYYVRVPFDDRCHVVRFGSIKGNPGADGEDGYSPAVTITEITGGHRVTITDEAHPQGQSFDVMDGTGGSGSSDYNVLTNKPSIAGVTLSGNKSLADLGIAAASDIPTVPVQSVNGKTGAVVLNASDVGAGTYSKPSGGIPKADLASAVQTSLGKADTALQTAPVTSVNGQTGAVTVAEPFVVTYSTNDMTTWTCDKTFAQIVAAMAAGKQVVMLASVAGTPIVQACSFVVLQSGIQAWVRIGQSSRYSIQHLSDNSVIITEFTESAQWLGAVPENQGVSHAGEFLVVDSDGNVTTMTLSTWQGGNY